MEKYTYKASGVDVKKGELLSEILVKKLKSANFNNFSGIYEHPFLNEYYLAATTDGIGTKIIPLLERNMLKTIANDLIAMNLNDLACVGAAPLFFLDYIASNTLDVKLLSEFIQILSDELSKYNTILIGGETSELSDFIKKGLFDIAGFAVGIVKKECLIDKKNITKGDILIGFESQGVHANGFTLIRKLHKEGKISNELFEKTLKPVRIYINEILTLVTEKLITGACNVTGGGIEGNLKRIIPENLCAYVDSKTLPFNDVFHELINITGKQEAFSTFNMGAGFILCAKKENVDILLDELKMHKPFILGEIAQNDGKKDSCVSIR